MLLRADDMILSLLRGLMASSNFLLTSLVGGGISNVGCSRVVGRLFCMCCWRCRVLPAGFLVRLGLFGGGLVGFGSGTLLLRTCC